MTLNYSYRYSRQHNRHKISTCHQLLLLSMCTFWSKKWSWIEPFKFQFKTIDFALKVERCAVPAHYYRFLRWKKSNEFVTFVLLFVTYWPKSRREFFNKWIELSETVISMNPIIKVNNCINVEFMMFRLWNENEESCPKSS